MIIYNSLIKLARKKIKINELDLEKYLENLSSNPGNLKNPQNFDFMSNVLKEVDNFSETLGNDPIDEKLTDTLNMLSAEFQFNLKDKSSSEKIEILIPVELAKILIFNTYPCSNFKFEMKNQKSVNEKNFDKKNVGINPYHTEKYLFYDMGEKIPKSAYKKFVAVLEEQNLQDKFLEIQKIILKIYSIRSPCVTCELLMLMPGKISNSQKSFFQRFSNLLMNNPKINMVCQSFEVAFRYSLDIMSEIDRSINKEKYQKEQLSLKVDEKALTFSSKEVKSYLENEKILMKRRSYYISSPFDSDFFLDYLKQNAYTNLIDVFNDKQLRFLKTNDLNRIHKKGQEDLLMQ